MQKIIQNGCVVKEILEIENSGLLLYNLVHVLS